MRVLVNAISNNDYTEFLETFGVRYFTNYDWECKDTVIDFDSMKELRYFIEELRVELAQRDDAAWTRQGVIINLPEEEETYYADLKLTIFDEDINMEDDCNDQT